MVMVVAVCKACRPMGRLRVFFFFFIILVSMMEGFCKSCGICERSLDFVEMVIMVKVVMVSGDGEL